MNELDTRAERFLESIRAEGEAACAAIREETEREVTGRLDETRRAENARVKRTLRFETERARTRANRDLSAARMAARAKLADQRQKIADETFAKAKAQLADFAASDKYAAWLQTEAAALAPRGWLPTTRWQHGSTPSTSGSWKTPGWRSIFEGQSNGK